MTEFLTCPRTRDPPGEQRFGLLYLFHFALHRLTEIEKYWRGRNASND